MLIAIREVLQRDSWFLLSRKDISNLIIYFVQFISWPFLFAITVPFLKFEISGKKNLFKIQKPVIITSNHISWYDSFLFRIVLGFKTQNLPLRFMAVDQFDWPVLNLLAKIGIIKILYKMFGVFTVVPGNGLSKNLEVAKRLLLDKGIIVIYPEGGIYTGTGLGRFRDGAAKLAIDHNIPIVPITMKLGPKFFRRHIRVNIGDTLKLSGDISEGTSLLYRKMQELYQS